MTLFMSETTNHIASLNNRNNRGLDITDFDRVWHEGLLYKLECSGISGKLLTLLRSFLTNRKQRVVLNGKISSWLTVKSGVPQGSVLAPLFFLLYIYDLVDGVHSDIKLFADDTSIFSVVKDKAEATETLNQDLERVRFGLGNGRCSLIVIKQKR